MKDYVIDMMEALPARDRNLILRTIELAIRAWDPDFTKLTPREEKEIEEELAEMDKGNYYTYEEVFGFTEEEALAATKGLKSNKAREEAIGALMERKKAETAAAAKKKAAAKKPAARKRTRRTSAASGGYELSAAPMAASGKN